MATSRVELEALYQDCANCGRNFCTEEDDTHEHNWDHLCCTECLEDFKEDCKEREETEEELSRGYHFI